jgi:hypothetical protein
MRAILVTVQDTPLYTETTTHTGEPIMFVLGIEPFLIGAGGLLFLCAGLMGWRARRHQTNSDAASPSTAV